MLPTMNRAVSLWLVLALGGVCLASAEDVLPRPAGRDRYLKMADRSPFAPPTPVEGVRQAVAAAPGPRWSDALSLGLLTQQGGVYFATIYDKNKNEHFLLQSDREDTGRQLALATVEWGETPDQITVTLRHNSEFAPVRFDPGALTAVPAAGAPAVAGLPAGINPPRLTPPPPPSMMPLPPNVQRRTTPIRTAPTVTAQPINPSNVQRRPLNRQDDE